MGQSSVGAFVIGEDVLGAVVGAKVVEEVLVVLVVELGVGEGDGGLGQRSLLGPASLVKPVMTKEPNWSPIFKRRSQKVRKRTTQ